MKKLTASKFLVSLTVASVVAAVGAVGYAETALKKVTAYQNADISIKVNGKTVDLSSEDGMMYPLVYDGHSYVSAKAVAEALGASVNWDDATQTVAITSGTGVSTNDGKPVKDNTNKPAPSAKPAPASGGSYSVSYPASITGSELYSDYKEAAKDVLTLYAEAMKSGDASGLKSWLDSHVQDNEYGNNHADDNYKYAKSTIDAIRSKYNQSVMDEYAATLTKSVSSYDFTSSSQALVRDTYFTLQYFADSDTEDYVSTAAVYFEIAKVGSKYLLTDVSIY